MRGQLIKNGWERNIRRKEIFQNFIWQMNRLHDEFSLVVALQTWGQHLDCWTGTEMAGWQRVNCSSCYKTLASKSEMNWLTISSMRPATQVSLAWITKHNLKLSQIISSPDLTQKVFYFIVMNNSRWWQQNAIKVQLWVGIAVAMFSKMS